MDTLSATEGLGQLLLGIGIFGIGMTLTLIKKWPVVAIGIFLAMAGVWTVATATGITSNRVLVAFVVALAALGIGLRVLKANRYIGGTLAALGVLALFGVIGLESLPRLFEDGGQAVEQTGSGGGDAFDVLIDFAEAGWNKLPW